MLINGGEEHHDGLAGRRVALQCAADLEPIALGHDEVQEDQVRLLLPSDLQCLLAILSNQYLETVVGPERRSDQVTD